MRALLVVLLLAAASVSHADYPPYQGPARDATLADPGLAVDWSSAQPTVRWKREVGEGWSALAVAGELVVTQEQRGGRQLVVAYHADDGTELWVHEQSKRYEHWLGGDGPRATPTIDGAHVFAVSARGKLSCLERTTGRLVWSRDLVRDSDGRLPEYGISCSPLVHGEHVIACAGGTDEGGSLVALRTSDGEPVWTAGRDQTAYSSPQLRAIAGVRQIVMLNRGSVSGHAPKDGRLLWEYPWESGKANVVQPLVLPGDRLLVTAGYGIGTKTLAVDRLENGQLEVRLAWESLRLKSKFANVVHHEPSGLVYGLDNETLVCLDAADGALQWKQGKYGHGQLLLVGDRLIVLDPDGVVTLIDPSREGPRVRGSFRAVAGKALNPPAMVGRRLYVRSNREAACIELPGQ